MKKIILVLALFLCYFTSYALMSQGELGMEMSGGYNFTALGNFNNNFTNVFNYGFLNGYSRAVTATSVPGIMQADVKLRYAVAAGLPLYLRLGVTKLEDTEILRDTVSGTDIATSVVSFNDVYIGAGLKYGFKLSPGFSIFLGADGGCFTPINSYWKVTGNIAQSPPVVSNLADPNYNADQRIDFTDVFFGANAGAGIEWALSNSYGIIVEGGYKMAKTPVTYQKTGIFTRAAFDFNELDFSGPYAKAGLVFYFGGKTAAAVRTAPAAFAGGDYYYSRKEYAKALNAYAAEYKQTRSNAVYKKIGITFYVMGQKQKAAFIFTSYLQYVPGDKQVRGWLQAIKK